MHYALHVRLLCLGKKIRYHVVHCVLHVHIPFYKEKKIRSHVVHIVCHSCTHPFLKEKKDT